MGRVRRGRSQREEIKRITDEYLESIRHKLTARDLELLRIVASHSVISSSHLLELCPGADSLPPFHTLSKGQQRLNDRLRVLFDLNLIRKVSPPLPPGEGTSRQYIWIDRGGVKLLGLTKRVSTNLPATYLHTSLCLDIQSTLHRLQRNNELRLYALDFERPLLTSRLVPDLVVLYRRKGVGYLSIVEVDRCEKKEADEIAKIQAYKAWQLSSAWMKESWARIMPTPKFPHVIYVIDPCRPSWKKRQTALRNAAEEVRLPFKTLTVQEYLQTLESSP